jgi:hypothetical protein
VIFEMKNAASRISVSRSCNHIHAADYQCICAMSRSGWKRVWSLWQNHAIHGVSRVARLDDHVAGDRGRLRRGIPAKAPASRCKRCRGREQMPVAGSTPGRVP